MMRQIAEKLVVTIVTMKGGRKTALAKLLIRFAHPCLKAHARLACARVIQRFSRLAAETLNKNMQLASSFSASPAHLKVPSISII
jgi:hypothetical protein